MAKSVLLTKVSHTQNIHFDDSRLLSNAVFLFLGQSALSTLPWAARP